MYERCLRGIKVESVEDLDRILRVLIGDYMKSIYTNATPGVLGKLEVCCRCTPRHRVGDSPRNVYQNGDVVADSEAPDPEEAEKEVREIVYRDLFIWSVLTNRIEMSKVFLNHMQTRICAALIASKIMKSYEEYSHDNESKDLFITRAKYFEDYASECLKCCYTCDEDIACEISIRRIDLFGGVSCLQVGNHISYVRQCLFVCFRLL